MAELTLTLIVAGMLALKAAVFVTLVRSSFQKLRSTFARARHYSGAGL
jgi:hypothetical protein